MARTKNSDTVASTDGNVLPGHVAWDPPGGEPPKPEPPAENPADINETRENGNANGSFNEGVIEEPESEPESSKTQNSTVNIEEMPDSESGFCKIQNSTVNIEEPESEPEQSNTLNSTVNIEEMHDPEPINKETDANPNLQSESSGDDEPLSRLRKPETPDLVHAAPSPNPFAHIRARPGLRSASPYRTQSVPVSPINFGFPPLTRVDGQLSLQKESDRKRPRGESPTTGQNSKRPCRGWPSLSNWWKGENGASQPQSATEALGNPNPRSCALM